MLSDFPAGGVFVPLLSWIWKTSGQAAVVAVLVLVLRGLFGRTMTRRLRHGLWALVLLRLVMPITANSSISIFTVVDFLGRKLVAGHDSALPNTAAELTKQSPAKTVVQYGPVPTNKLSFTNGSTVEARSAEWRWAMPVICGVWLAGALFFMARLAIVNMLFWRHLRRTSQPADARFNSSLAACCRELGMNRPPVLLLTDAVSAPAVGGLFRGRLLMPPGLAGRLSQQELRLVFLHELTHIKCFDVAVDWAWAMVQSAHWFNPIFRLIDNFRRSDRELARDEMVLSLTGAGDADCYGRIILDLTQLGKQLRFCPGLIGIVSHRKSLERRINMIANFTRPGRGFRWVGLSLLILAGCAVLTNPRTKADADHAAHAATTAPVAAAPVVREVDSLPLLAPEDAAIRSELDQRQAAVVFNATPFADVIDFFRVQTGLNIYVDWAALERAKIARNAPVTARLRNIKVSKALELIFKCVEGEPHNDRLGYTIDGGVVTITTHREIDKNVVTERYDVNDLLFIPPSYENFVDPGPTTRPSAEETRKTRMEELRKYIVDNVAPDSWRDNGGDVGTIGGNPPRALFLITQTPENQRYIKEVLQSLRESQSYQISLETRFFTLDDVALAKLSDDVRQRLKSAARNGKEHGTEPLTKDQVAELVRVIATSKRSTEITAPRITLFSGQHATIIMTTSTSYIASMKATVKQTGDSVATTYEPQVGNALQGLRMDVLATVSPDFSSAFVDFHPMLTQLDRLDSERWPGAPLEEHVSIQKPVISTFELQATRNIPDGASMVLGGFDESKADIAGAAGDSALHSGSAESAMFGNLVTAALNGQLYMLVKPTILKMGRPLKETQVR